MIDTLRRTMRGLIANMIGEEHRVDELYKPMDNLEDFPPELRPEATVLRALWHCYDSDVKPTKQNLIAVLSVVFEWSDEQIDSILGDIESYATVYREVNGMSFIIIQTLDKHKTELLWSEAVKTVMTPLGTIEQRHERALEILAKVPYDGGEDGITRDEHEADAWYVNTILKKRRDRFINGDPVGPSLKFTGFHDQPDKPGLIPYLRWGQSTAVSADSKAGKTTLGGIWAEYNAWRVGGIDVLYLHLETEQETMIDRSIVRNAKVPMNYLGSGQVDMSDPDDVAANRIKWFVDWKKTTPRVHPDGHVCEDPGTITYLHCPGYTIDQVKLAIALHRRMAEKNGHGLLVIIDYYSLIDPGTRIAKLGLGTVDTLGRIALELRNVIQKENRKSPVHAIIFSQQSTRPDGSVNTYGSRQLQFYVQAYITLIREEAEHDNAVLKNEAGKEYQQYDLVGNRRYYHRVGQWHSDSILRVVMGNDVGQGDVYVRFENNAYTVTDLNHKPAWLKQDLAQAG